MRVTPYVVSAATYQSPRRAKYIEGLENRLGRMESLLRLSGMRHETCRSSFPQPPANTSVGLLGEDDNGATDLGTLERKLAEKHQQSRQASQAVSNPTSPSQATSGQDGNHSTPRSSVNSPEPTTKESEKQEPTPEKDKPEAEQEVAALSEMMCSLVTNNDGETRYIGKFPGPIPIVLCCAWLTTLQDPHPASPSSRPRASSGSIKRWGTTLSKR